MSSTFGRLFRVSTFGESHGGGVGVIDFGNNLTYIDVRILERGGGGGRR